MKNAKAVEGVVVFSETEHLPDGTVVGIVKVEGWEEVRRLPKVVSLDGSTMLRTGWNSDRNVAYYRNDYRERIASY